MLKKLIKKLALTYAEFLVALRPLELAVLIKFFFPLKRRIINMSSTKLSVDPISAYGLRLIKNNEYEQILLDEILKTLDNGSTFVDLGANEGFFSIIASSKCGNDGNIIAIEPQQSMVQVINTNINLNGINNITIIKKGVSNALGKTRIINYPSINTGASRIGSSWRYRLYKSEEIELDTLDNILSSCNVNIVDAIKIDIEGYEYNALMSANDLLNRKLIKNLFVEIHPQYLKDLNQTSDMVREFMESKSYNFREINDVYHFYL